MCEHMCVCVKHECVVHSYTKICMFAPMSVYVYDNIKLCRVEILSRFCSTLRDSDRRDYGLALCQGILFTKNFVRHSTFGRKRRAYTPTSSDGFSCPLVPTSTSRLTSYLDILTNVIAIIIL